MAVMLFYVDQALGYHINNPGINLNCYPLEVMDRDLQPYSIIIIIHVKWNENIGGFGDLHEMLFIVNNNDNTYFVGIVA